MSQLCIKSDRKPFMVTLSKNSKDVVHDGPDCRAFAKDHLLSSYDFDLPTSLVAQRPMEPRHNSRLFYVGLSEESELRSHHQFLDLINLLPKNSLLIFNQSKVFPCRLKVSKLSGGRGEIFFLSQKANSSGQFSVLIKSNSKKEIGQSFLAINLSTLKITIVAFESQNDSALFLVEVLLNGRKIEELKTIEEYLFVPIPPYIRQGESDLKDKADYQTIYAKDDFTKAGSVAAPTAGLHFTAELMELLLKKEIEFQFIDLDVGLGTFSPIKSESLSKHKMHREYFSISVSVLQKLEEAYSQGKKVFAVGTTTLRALESWYQKKWQTSLTQDFHSCTDIFIHPGKKVRSIDGLITNFHLPKSSLFILVSALLGRERALDIYREAIQKEYRFFSYGDALFINNLKRGADDIF